MPNTVNLVNKQWLEKSQALGWSLVSLLKCPVEKPLLNKVLYPQTSAALSLTEKLLSAMGSSQCRLLTGQSAGNSNGERSVLNGTLSSTPHPKAKETSRKKGRGKSPRPKMGSSAVKCSHTNELTVTWAPYKLRQSDKRPRFNPRHLKKEKKKKAGGGRGRDTQQ